MDLQRKRIVIVSASIGTGHMQAAKAIQEYYEHTEPLAEVRHVDFFAKESLSLDMLIKETYIKLIDIFPMFYDVLYRMSQGEKQGNALQTIVSWLMKSRMLKLVRQEKPDVLVFTHPFPCGAACILKRQRLINVPIVGVITDYTVHQFWVYPQVDRYCVGSNTLVQPLRESGIASEKIVVTGMPIRMAYWDRPLRDYYSGAPVKALVMGGGLGLGAIRDVLLQLDKVTGLDHITVVTGYNEDLYDTIVEMKSHFRKPVEVLGYTSKVPALMKESSILLTKPGGLTCREATSVGLPMVFFSAIPGQEEGNADLFVHLGCAKWAKHIDGLSKMVESIISDPAILQAMSDASVHMQERGTERIARVLRQLLWKEEKKATSLHNKILDATK